MTMTPEGIAIQPMASGDAEAMLRTFEAWGKRPEQFQRYAREQASGYRSVWCAWRGAVVVGYVTLMWTSEYRPFREQHIPEIVDLNVITPYQQRGIGSALIAAAEDAARAAGCETIGISAVQSPEYDPPNRLYPQLGYTPDGRGTTPWDNELHLTKLLRPGAPPEP